MLSSNMEDGEKNIFSIFSQKPFVEIKRLSLWRQNVGRKGKLASTLLQADFVTAYFIRRSIMHKEWFGFQNCSQMVEECRHVWERSHIMWTFHYVRKLQIKMSHENL